MNTTIHQQNSITSKRIESIDVLRGIVMVIMALDHVRDYVHIGANLDNPLNLQTTTPILFFTRWITHFCAPIFILLSGTSIYLQSHRKTQPELGFFLLKRGAWLILAEWTIIAFGWTFNPTFSVIPFQVIWAIGISMVILGLIILIRLPFSAILSLGLLIVFGHNMLDSLEQAPGFQSNFWWDLFHHSALQKYSVGDHNIILVYPFIPWTGVMMLGYCLGILFTPAYSSSQRSKLLLLISLGLLALFILLRLGNAYGDPLPWSHQKNGLYTFFSFIHVQKYPPSLLYVCLTIGIALLVLSLIENIKNRFTDMMMVFGRTAFFYYICHLYLIHLIAVICFFSRGHSFAEAGNIGAQFPFMFVVPGEGFNLWGVYAVWLIVIVILYPVCKWYDQYKLNNKNKLWLSYL
jgi:uncharacterized membrane protein